MYRGGMSSTVAVRSAADVPWDEIVAVFGERGDPSRCWCQFFRLANAEFEASTVDERRELLRREVTDDGTTPGLVAFIDDSPAGWVAVRPRRDYARLLRSPIVTTSTVDPIDDDSVWSVSCFVVRPEFRRRGASSALLDAAVETARANGARVVEAYPTDLTGRPRMSASDLYRGTLGVFERAGFTRIDAGGTRAVVRLEV
jgi:GNAT superfamily N-acetyltransferase